MNKKLEMPLVLENELQALVADDLEPLFWVPRRIGKGSAWWEHVPFAFWIVHACKPGSFVELGTHHGVSYAAFCEAVVRSGLATRCHAIDTWEGDAHAGVLDEQTYGDLRAFHDRHYSAFSELLRSRFDDALPYFSDGSIDLLHIDGFHTYEAVRHDFESWRPKLSDRAVVLLHDTNVRERGFGVGRLFDELRMQYPCFEFLHGHGLGVVMVGANAPAAARALCTLADASDIRAVRERFAHLGGRWFAATREQIASEEVGAHIDRVIAAKTADLEGTTLQRVADAQALAQQQVGEARALAEQAEARHRKSSELRNRAARRIAVLRRAIESLKAKARESQGLNQKEAVQARQAQGALADLASRLDEAQRIAKAAQGRLAELSVRYGRAFLDPSMRMQARLRRRVRGWVLRLRGKGLQIHITETIRRSVYFDRDWYLARYPDVAASGIDPAEHYAHHGGAEGREPGPWFCGGNYLAGNPDVVASGMNALYHFLQHGQQEGRRGGAVDVALESVQGHAVAGAAGRYSLLYVSGEPDTPGNQYRVMRFVEAARRNDVQVEWVRLDQLEGRIDDLDCHDVLVIWRAPWTPALAAAVDRMKSCGGKVIFDVDDLMVDPALAEVKVIDGIRSQSMSVEIVRDHFERIRQTMLAADLCFASTRELASHMQWAGKVVHVLPNGFDDETHQRSRQCLRQWRRQRSDDWIRIGYAGGSRTHQRDFESAVEAIARILARHEKCRLVLFRAADGVPLVDVNEYPVLKPFAAQIEWRPIQALAGLPAELARFDINLAPLEVGNPFCEAKSDLKFFEAALVEVPTVASPTGPFRRAIEHGKTGFLAASAEDWYACLERLVTDPPLRAMLARNAYHVALARYGVIQRTLQLGSVLDQLKGGAQAARAFAFGAHLASRPVALPKVFPSEIVFEKTAQRSADVGTSAGAEVTVVIPLYNYQDHVVEALESVRQQTLPNLDLVIVDGNSTDRSLEVATVWAQTHAKRFNRIVVLRNKANYGLGYCRNSGFDAADTPYVLPLDADNRLLPECCIALLETIREQKAAYVYPMIRHFGASVELMGAVSYDPQRFAAGNYVDAMALISKEAWAINGGYEHVKNGWEDYDFWCRLAEKGIPGHWKNAVLAEYRVHPASMMKVQTTVTENYRRLHADFRERHPWVAPIEEERLQQRLAPSPHMRAERQRTRLDALLPILRCPRTRQKLALSEADHALVSMDRLAAWPIVEGRPVLAAGLEKPEIRPQNHVSNELAPVAQELIRNAQGWVLNLSGGGSAEKFDHVVEVEYAVFRHTDVVADAHELPFDDNTFEAAVVMNAFEHYRDPKKVAAELFRVLKPGGKILIYTAFMQPLHEKPWHFFNCTRHGLEQWFSEFEADRLQVSGNFCPNHSLAWIASEAESALRNDVSGDAANEFRNASIGELVDIWRKPEMRESDLWKNFEKLSQESQEGIAAGFEYLGRKPQEGARVLQ